MERYDFKGDFTNSVFRLMGRILMVVLLVQVLVSLFTFLMTTLVAPGLLTLSQDMQSIMQSGGSPEEWAEQMKNVTFGSGGVSIGAIVLIVLISLILSLATYNVIFNSIKNEVTEGDNSLGSAFSNVFDVRLLKYIALYFIMALAFLAVVFLFGLIGSPTLIFIVMLLLTPVLVWFSISYAAIGIDNSSISEGLSLASSNFTAARWAKTLGIGIVVFIILAIAGMIIGLIASLFIKIPAVGPILGQIVNAALSAVIMAFILAGFSGLYFKYSNSLKAEEEFLVTD